MSSVTFSTTVGGDGSTVTDDTNPTTGLDGGGHRTRFVPALAQTVAVAAHTVAQASTATTKAGEATTARNEAVTARNEAVAARDTAVTTTIPALVAQVDTDRVNAQAAIAADVTAVDNSRIAAQADIAADVAAVEAAKNTAVNEQIPARVALVDEAVAATYVGQAGASATAAAASAATATAARDSTFFNAGRTFATISAGLAGSTDGQQFAVVEGDYVQIYTRTNSTTATIVNGARYPTADSIAFLRTVGQNNFDKDQPLLANTRINSTTGAPDTNPSYLESLSGFIPIIPGAPYITNSAFSCFVAQYDANRAFISGTHASVTRSTAFTPVESARFIRLSTTGLSTFMLEQATNWSREYVPYAELVDSEKINYEALLARQEIKNNLAFVGPGVNIFDKDQGLIAGSVISGSNGLPLSGQSGRFLSGFIPVKPSTQYATNAPSNFNVAYYTASKAYIGNVETSVSSPFTTPVDAGFIRLSLWGPGLTLQIEQGPSFTSYRPYVRGYQGPLSESEVAKAVKWAVNDLALPSNQYFLANEQNNIYYQAIQRRHVPSLFYTRITGTGMHNRERQARITPTAAGSIALTSRLYDGEFDILSTKTSTAIVASKTTPTTPIKLLAIGDSQTFQGFWLGKIQEVIPEITTLGIRAGSNITTVMHEGRSGWTLDNLFTRHGNFGFNGFTPFMHPAGQRYMGTTRSWLAVAATPLNADIVGMTAIYATLAPDAQGRPTRDPGSASLASGAVIYNNAATSYQLWDGASWANIAAPTFAFDFAKYLTTYGVQTPDAVTMMLGTNDFGSVLPRNVATSFAAFKTQLDTVIASAFSAGVTKFGIMIPPSTRGSMEDSAGTNFTRLQDASMWEARRLMIETYDNRTGEGIYVIDVGSALDPDFGFEFTTAEKPFAEYTGTETIKPMFNLPHPSVAGYAQIGVRVAAWLQAVR
jgi:lysophospholipase L1-like esterase